MNRVKYEMARLSAAVRGVLPATSPIHLGTRVLMFHDLTSGRSRRDVYSLPAETFMASIPALTEWVATEHSQFVAFSGEPLPGVAITFDDGYQSTFKVASQVLSELSIPFHIFVTKQFVEGGNDRFLTREDIQTLSKNPLVTFGLHGVTHTPFTQLTSSALTGELRDSRKWLEDLIGRPVETLSYPHGDFNQPVTDIVASEGFVAAAGSAVGTFRLSQQRLTIPRIDVWSLDTTSVIVAKTRGDWDHILP